MSTGASPGTTGGVAGWARSGAMALTGWPAGPGVTPPGDVAGRLDRLVDRVEAATAGFGSPVRLDWGQLLSGRAALLGLARGGRISANRSARLIEASDGWVALNLPRDDDRAAVPALVAPWAEAMDPPGDPEAAWAVVERAARSAPAGGLVARARLLGLAAAGLGEAARPIDPESPWRTVPRPAAGPARPRRWGPVRVVDLSAMWAGPLVARILMSAGAEVTKVESPVRPDGARATPDFYRWLHPDDQPVVPLDPGRPSDRPALARRLAEADVVIESSRPRALQQAGLDPGTLPARPGQVWLSITGHGRQPPADGWIGFGDDAAVGGGLVGWDGEGGPVFCADAVADPLTGLFGAVAVAEAWAGGEAVLIDLPLSAAAAAVAEPAGSATPTRPTAPPRRLAPVEMTAARRPDPFPEPRARPC